MERWLAAMSAMQRVAAAAASGLTLTAAVCGTTLRDSIRIEINIETIRYTWCAADVSALDTQEIVPFGTALLMDLQPMLPEPISEY